MSPRKRFVRHEVDGAARFLTFSCYGRLPLFENDHIKDRFVTQLTTTSVKREMTILAWVVMPEHIHLVVLPHEAGDVTTFLNSLKTSFGSTVIRRWRMLDAAILDRLRDTAGDVHFWQLGGGYDRCVIGKELAEKIRYCHTNPITRGLCEQTTDWQWSSARAYESRPDYAGPPIAVDLLPRSPHPLT